MSECKHSSRACFFHYGSVVVRWKVWSLYIWHLVGFFLKIYFIYSFLAALGLRCCAQALSSRSEQGPLSVVARGLLIVVASPVAEHGLQAHRLQ